jgi:formylmethanofuran dehydrogenase subunit E
MVIYRPFFIFILFTTVLLIISCKDNSNTHNNLDFHITNCIIDTDMGLDDIRALMALLADSTINIQGILTVEGSAAIGKATDNLIGMLETYHIESIPVLMGYNNPNLIPPSCRIQANETGGSKFPPPRNLSALKLTPAVFEELIHHTNNSNYLALGPLGNLAKITREYPEAFKRIKKIWIPAMIKENRLTDWNLLYDPESAQQVFNSVPNIEIIDLSIFSKQEAIPFLSSLKDNSSSVQWISSTLKHSLNSSEHLFLYDDIVSAAVINEDLIETSNQTYSCRLFDNKYFELTPDPDGNIRIISIKNVSAVLATLKNQWQIGPLRGHAEIRNHAVPVRDLLRTFHGHLGPYVVIGYRMGKLALKELNSDGHFGLSVEVHSILKPPFSCLIDGIQLGSGCTLGKRNIQILSHEGSGWAIFKSHDGLQKTIYVKSEIPKLVQQYVDEKGVETAAEELLNMALSDLFEIE